VNRPALVVGVLLLLALLAVTAVGEYVRWNLPSGDEKLTACRAIPPESSLTTVVGVLGQPTMRQAADLAEGAVWLEFRGITRQRRARKRIASRRIGFGSFYPQVTQILVNLVNPVILS